MKILYIHQYFKIPSEPGGTRSFWFSKELIASGHDVVVITNNQSIRHKIVVKYIEGICVIYLKVPYNNSMSIPRRFLSFFHFMILSTWTALKIRGIDLTIATSTPLSIGFPALVLRFIKRIPYVFEVRDLWPEVPIQMGALRNTALKKLAISFEYLIYQKAEHIIALSPGMLEGVLNTGAPRQKVSMIPNMSKNDKFWPREANKILERRLGLKPESFKLIHFGAMGIANGLDYILNAALLAKDVEGGEDIDFIFLGEGNEKKRCREFVRAQELHNVYFLDNAPMDVTSDIVNLCDASIVTFLDIPILRTNSPNKLFDSLSAGLPVIVNSDGWTRHLVEEFRCGVYVNPQLPQQLVDVLVYWKSNPLELEKMGHRGRALAAKRYDKSILAKDFCRVITQISIDSGVKN